MNISFEGFGQKCLTFMTDEKLEPGTIVKMDDSGKVTASGDDDIFIGYVVNSDDEYAVVCISGVAVLPCSDDDIEPGYVGLSTDSTGKVCDGLNSKLRLVLAADTQAGTVTVIL